jgi:restriction system protein
MDPDWRRYQEDVAQFFRELGLSAQTNVTINGVRTKHDVDVLVESTYKGISIRWIVECKSWKRPVPKLNVLALRTIIEDVGADRGFLMNEAGYQKGRLKQLT